MPDPQLRSSQMLVQSQRPPSEHHLSAEDWGMILEALSAYKHNTSFRDLYEKAAARRPAASVS